MLVPKGSRPPPEFSNDVEKSGLIPKIRSSGCLFTDGAQGWKATAKKLKPRLTVRTVAHNKMEFVKKVTKVRRSHSSMAGTQIIDRRWGVFKRYIPKEMKAKVGKDINPALKTYLYSWVFRQQMQSQDWLTEVGKLCKGFMHS